MIGEMPKLLRGKTNMVKSFTTMVKSGEVYVTNDKEISRGILIDASERPRSISVPPAVNCSHPVYFQSLLWAPLRKVIPGFIQAYDKENYAQWIANSGIQEDWRAISIDGSAFDSTQFAELMDCCENTFFKLIQDSAKCREAFLKMALSPESDIQIDTTIANNLYDSILESSRKNDTILYTRLPSYLYNAKRWPKEVEKDF